MSILKKTLLISLTLCLCGFVGWLGGIIRTTHSVAGPPQGGFAGAVRRAAAPITDMTSPEAFGIGVSVLALGAFVYCADKIWRA